MTSFQLSCSLEGHSQDIKSLTVIDQDRFASASRDTTVLIWTRVDTRFQQTGLFSKHSHFVNALAYIAPSPTNVNGLVVSAGNDKTIYCFDPLFPGDYVLKLEGHSDNICVLGVSPNGIIISGSWDKTARIWKDGKCKYILRGHQFAIWGVLAINDDSYLTASADRTIKLWKGDREMKTFTGHQDVVRKLALIPSLGFLSCSNDSSIRTWTLDGECIAEAYGHTSFVYSVAVLPTGEFVSCGEDRTVRVWNGTNQVQSIVQPCISVWAIAIIGDGDIIVGGSDGIIRIFTRDPARIASAAEIEAYESVVASSSIPSNQIGDLNKQNVAGLDALQIAGKKEGEVKMIRNGSIVEAYQWSDSDSQWHKIGEVVDAVGSTRKQVFQGKEYDYVFDVDVQEGAPPLKLPYNQGENPYEAAQNFIFANEIPQDYLDQVANFIIANAKNITLGDVPASSNNADPFTGAGRYVPGGKSQLIKSNLIPMKSYTFIKTANLKAIVTKIQSLNQEITTSSPTLALSSAQVVKLTNMVDCIDKNTISKTLTREDWEVLSIMLFEWPDHARFPAIDILRLIILQTAAPLQFANDLLQKSFPILENCKPNDKILETNAMLAVRVYCNAFGQKEYFPSLEAVKSKLLSLTSRMVSFRHNKNLQMALATLFLNFAVLANDKSDVDFESRLLEQSIILLKNAADSDIILRAIVIIGSLLECKPNVKPIALSNGLGGLLDIPNANTELSTATEHVKGLLF